MPESKSSREWLDYFGPVESITLNAVGCFMVQVYCAKSFRTVKKAGLMYTEGKAHDVAKNFGDQGPHYGVEHEGPHFGVVHDWQGHPVAVYRQGERIA